LSDKVRTNKSQTLIENNRIIERWRNNKTIEIIDTVGVKIVVVLFIQFVVQILFAASYSYTLLISMAEQFPNAGGLGGAAAADNQDDGSMVDLGIKIESASCYARNESKAFPMSNLFIGDSRLGCKSDADEQIILHVEFSEFVKVRPNKQGTRCVTSDNLSKIGGLGVNYIDMFCFPTSAPAFIPFCYTCRSDRSN
jgi:hypothetical protein